MAMTGGTAKLVHTGYGQNGNRDYPINLYVYYKTSQDISTNKSTITCGMYVTTPSSNHHIDWTYGTSYVGTTSLTFSGDTGYVGGTIWLTENRSFTVSHNDDGTGTATIQWKWNVNSTWGGFVYPSGSFTITLPTIARASVPTVSASSVKMGNNLTIYTNRKSSSFTHTLKYTFGGTTATIATGVGASYTWKVPDLAAKCNNALNGTATISCLTYSGGTLVETKTVDVTLNVPDATPISVGTVILGNSSGTPLTTTPKSTNFRHTVTYSFHGATGTIVTKGYSSFIFWAGYDLAKQIKDKTEGKGTLTCVTYNGTATVGTTTCEFTAVVPNNETTKPKITTLNLAPSGNLPSAFDGLYIQGKTKVVADFTASSDYSTVSSYKMTVQDRSYTGDPATSDLLPKSGSTVVKGVVTDARGYPSAEKEQTITVIPYDFPKILPHSSESGIICARCTSDGTLSDTGQFLKIKAKRSYSKVMSGNTQKNFCTLSYKVGSGNPVVLLGKNSTEDEIDFDPIAGVVESTTTSYTVQLIVSDDISGSTPPYTFNISTADTDFHLKEGGNGGAFGKFAEKDGVLECVWDAEFNKTLTAKHLGKIDWYDNKDFNELIYNTGYYTGTSVPSAVKCSNYPIDTTGVLEVVSQMGQNSTTLNWWGFAYQTYKTYKGQVYTRSYFSSEGWTEWCLMDGLVEQGFSSPWYYKKFASGDAECYCSRSIDVSINTAWGSALYYGTVSTIGYPFTFKEPPVCNVDVEYGSTSSSLFTASCGKGTESYARPIMLVRTDKGTINCKLLYQVKGRWK